MIRQEIEALEILGINPVRNLILPRVVGLCLWMPVLALLTFWAGIAGTFCAAVFLYDATIEAFFSQLLTLTNFIDLWGSVVKLTLFGAIIGIIAAYKGLQVGGGAEGVGKAVNESVVACLVVIGVVTRRLHAALPGVLPGGELRRMSEQEQARMRLNDEYETRKPNRFSEALERPGHLPLVDATGAFAALRRSAGSPASASCPSYTAEVLRQIGLLVAGRVLVIVFISFIAGASCGIAAEAIGQAVGAGIVGPLFSSFCVNREIVPVHLRLHRRGEGRRRASSPSSARCG